MWLRYSSSRQLTWQRNYNTQPRILGEAQARLTNAIAKVLPCYLYTISPCASILDPSMIFEVVPGESEKIYVPHHGIWHQGWSR